MTESGGPWFHGHHSSINNFFFRELLLRCRRREMKTFSCKYVQLVLLAKCCLPCNSNIQVVHAPWKHFLAIFCSCQCFCAYSGGVQVFIVEISSFFFETLEPYCRRSAAYQCGLDCVGPFCLIFHPWAGSRHHIWCSLLHCVATSVSRRRYSVS